MSINTSVPIIGSLIFFFFNLFFGCAGSSLLHAGFPQLQQAGATLRCGARASHRGGFSCCRAWALGTWAQLLQCAGSRAHGLLYLWLQTLECRLSSCGPQAQLLHGMWDLPRPGIKPVSPALAGGFLTTASPGKSPTGSLLNYMLLCLGYLLPILCF